jgi:signal transduction histidine kinase
MRPSASCASPRTSWGEANAELRDLARGLHPVALSERGLVRALEGLAAGCDAPVTIDVRADGLPEHIELATYFLVSESLANAGKYAGANAIRIRVEREHGALLVEIADAADSPPGAGTRVSARLPLAAAG